MRRTGKMTILLLCMLLMLSGCSVPQLEQKQIDEFVGHAPSSQQAESNRVVESVSTERYAYTQLSEEGKRVYDEIYAAICDQSEAVTVSTLDADILNQAYNSVGADYGGLFWVEGYTYTEYTMNGELVGLEFAPKYTMSLEERETIQQQIDEKVEQLLGGISSEESDYQKARFVFDTLISTVNYNKEAANSQNIISVFLNGSTVCQGYASATQYLMEILGIPCTIIAGEASGEAHAWNLILLDGAYYYMDTTWGNSSYLNQDSTQQKFVNYSYFAVTSEEMAYTHQASDLFDLPECDAVADSYYVQESRYFTDWQPEVVGEMCTHLDSGAVSMKFADASLYAQAEQYFIEEGHLHDFYTGELEVLYMEDADLFVLTFVGK